MALGPPGLERGPSGSHWQSVPPTARPLFLPSLLAPFLQPINRLLSRHFTHRPTPLFARTPPSQSRPWTAKPELRPLLFIFLFSEFSDAAHPMHRSEPEHLRKPHRTPANRPDSSVNTLNTIPAQSSANPQSPVAKKSVYTWRKPLSH